MRELVLETTIEAGDWTTALPDHKLLAEAAVQAALATVRGPRSVQLSLLLTDDPGIRTLNREHRGKDKPTNVLSWPARQLARPGHTPLLWRRRRHDPPGPAFLGDVALSLDSLLREAKAGGLSDENALNSTGVAPIPVSHHFCHLIVHAVLHIMGYDHETPADAALMETREIAALAQMGLPNPYARWDETGARTPP